MTVLMISYDLNGNEQPSAYAAVKKMIEANAPDHIRPLYSQWLINTEASPQAWHERMKRVADADDVWFIIEVTRPMAGQLEDQSEVDWIEDRVPRENAA